MEKIGFELRRLRDLENRLTDATKNRGDVKAVIARLEMEKAALSSSDE